MVTKYIILVYNTLMSKWERVLETKDEIQAINIKKRLEKNNKIVHIDYEEENK